MTNPDRKDRFTKVNNDLFEKVVRSRLSGGEKDLIWVVIRYTYGFQRERHSLAINFIKEATGLSRSTVQDCREKLIKKKILIATTERGKTSSLSINENFNEWELEEVKETKNKKNKKETPKKTKRVYEESDKFYKMAKHFLDLVTPVAEEAGVSHLIAKANLQSWTDDFRKLWEIDEVQDRKQILAVMEWVTQHDFWRVNVLSGKKFRDKYTELAIKMAADKKPKQNKFQHPSHSVPDARDEEIAFNKWVASGGDPNEFTYSG